MHDEPDDDSQATIGNLFWFNRLSTYSRMNLDSTQMDVIGKAELFLIGLV